MTSATLRQYPYAEKVLDELQRQMPFLRKAAQTAPGTPLEQRLPLLDFIARRLEETSGGEWLVPSVRSYGVLSLEFLKLQRELDRTGRYLLSTEREAFERAYGNKDVFGGYYIPAMLLSIALWPNHHLMDAAFVETFVPTLPVSPKVIEVGVGSGLHLFQLLRARPKTKYLGVDITQFAIDFATSFALSKDKDKYDVSFTLQNVMDGLPNADGSFDAAVCGEVLEHVERPDLLLRELRRLVKPGGRFFTTTAIWAANIDHIYLYENARQVRDMISECGWTIEHEWVIPVYADVDPESSRSPMSYAAQLVNA